MRDELKVEVESRFVCTAP